MVSLFPGGGVNATQDDAGGGGGNSSLDIGAEADLTLEGGVAATQDFFHTSLMPPESFINLLSSPGPSDGPATNTAVQVTDDSWVVGVGVGVEQSWVEILILALKGVVMAAVIIASVLGNLLIIVSVAR